MSESQTTFVNTEEIDTIWYIYVCKPFESKEMFNSSILCIDAFPTFIFQTKYSSINRYKMIFTSDISKNADKKC